MIFGEKLPLGWWLGAALLAAGNVVIGRREEVEKTAASAELDQTRGEAQEAESLLSEQDGDLLAPRMSLERHTTNPTSGHKATTGRPAVDLL